MMFSTDSWILSSWDDRWDGGWADYITRGDTTLGLIRKKVVWHVVVVRHGERGPVSVEQHYCYLRKANARGLFDGMSRGQAYWSRRWFIHPPLWWPLS